MRKVLEVLRLLFDQSRSQREISTILGLSQSTVHEYVRRFRATGCHRRLGQCRQRSDVMQEPA